MSGRKIAFISASQIPSTTANSIQVMKVCQAFAQIGHSVRLLVPGDQRVSWKELALHYGLNTQFEVEWLTAHPGLHKYDFAWRAVRRARLLGSEILYAWPLQASLFALLWRFPVLLEVHEPPAGRLGPFLFRLFCRLHGKKRLLPITHALKELLLSRYVDQLVDLSIVVLPDGVDLERYQNLPEPAAARHQIGLPEQITVGYTGHLYAGRGIGLLLELARRFPEVHFLWVGGRAEDVQRWQNRITMEQIRNVTLTGFVENARLPLYQAAADILVMPYERVIRGSSGGNTADFCSPMKMFEYMACGRAIIASDLSVLREVLHDGNALFCPPEDIVAWCQALTSLIKDPQRRLELARQAQQDVRLYSWEQRAQRSLEGFG